MDPVIATPGQLSRRAEFYYQLNQLTGAGLGVVQALQQMQRNPPSRSFRRPIGRVLEQLSQGCTFTEALRRTRAWLPAFDITLVEAGEKSGRLDQCFRLLADYYSERARIARQMIADLAYPVFLFHFAVLIFPFPHLFLTGDWWGYLRQVLVVLAPLYLLVAGLIYALQSKHSESWRSGIEAVLHRVPVLGTGRRSLALSRLAAALESLLSAGVNIVEAWELAAAASGSPALRRGVQGWKPLLDAGQTPAEIISASANFPHLFSNQYATGEISGRLDDVLRRLHQYYQEEGSRKLHTVAKWAPMAIYLTIMVVIAYKIITFYMGYFGQLRDAGGY